MEAGGANLVLTKPLGVPSLKITIHERKLNNQQEIREWDARDSLAAGEAGAGRA